MDSSLNFLTVKQVADILHVSVMAVNRYMEKGGLKYSKLGTSKNSQIRISLKDLKEFITVKEDSKRGEFKSRNIQE